MIVPRFLYSTRNPLTPFNPSAGATLSHLPVPSDSFYEGLSVAIALPNFDGIFASNDVEMTTVLSYSMFAKANTSSLVFITGKLAIHSLSTLFDIVSRQARPKLTGVFCE
ncbi:MAG: hypothetical protein MK193_00775 [Lentisphaeria bacterium]|nr:hypothetical protein [Lentisphaeria bacterium]